MILKLQWVNALCVAVVPALSECAEIDPSIFRGWGGGGVPAVTCLSRAEGYTKPLHSPFICKTPVFHCYIPHSASVRECLQHLRRSAGVSPSFSSYQCARVYFLTRRSPAALREVAWSESDRPKKEEIHEHSRNIRV